MHGNMDPINIPPMYTSTMDPMGIKHGHCPPLMINLLNSRFLHDFQGKKKKNPSRIPQELPARLLRNSTRRDGKLKIFGTKLRVFYGV